MDDLRKFGATSNRVRFKLRHNVTGQGLTGLSSASSGLIISTIADNEATATTYTVAGSTIESITTLGTFAAPTATKCRFKEVDATNHKGLYEFQFADARFAVTNARALTIDVTGASNLLDREWRIVLAQFDPFDTVRLGLTALPNAAAEAAGGLYTRGTGAGQITQAANGQIDVSAMRLYGNTVAAQMLSYSAMGIYAGTITGASPTTTTLVDSALGGKATDFYKNAVILFTSGAQTYQRAQVTGYNGGTNTLTFTALTGAAAQGDTYVLL